MGRVLLSQDVAGDLDQERVEIALVPAGEDVRQLVRLDSEKVAQHEVGLGDQLHVGVLDAVVHHLHVVPGAVRSDVRSTALTAPDRPTRCCTLERLSGLAVDLGRDGRPDRFDRAPSFPASARHQGRTETGALLAAGHTRADEVQPLSGQVLFPADRVRPQAVAAVDENVGGVEHRPQLFDHGVHRRPGLDQHHDPAGPFETTHEFVQAPATHETAWGVGVPGDELLHHRYVAVERGHAEPVIGHVQGQVATHHGQSDHSDVSLRAVLFRGHELRLRG